MEQLKENIEVESYRELKEKAENRTEWKLLHRQEPSSWINDDETANIFLGFRSQNGKTEPL